jgi:hypothetical protein
MRDIKSFDRAMKKKKPHTKLGQCLDAAIHDLNFGRPRPMLGGKTASETFEQGRKPLPTRWMFRRRTSLVGTCEEQGRKEAGSTKSNRRGTIDVRLA